MQYSDPSEFWWTGVAGPHEVVHRVAMTLLENKTCILHVPSDMPWPQKMRSCIQAEYTERTDEYSIIKMIDLQDEDAVDIPVGKFVLNKLAPPNISAGYREKSKVSIQKYISSSGILKNEILWVKGISQSETGKWISFCKGFTPNNKSGGLFVLEINHNIRNTDSKRFVYVNYDDYVSSYDLQLFNSFLLDDENVYSDAWKKYISALASSLCDVDAEVSDVFLHNTDFRSESPLLAIQRIAESEDFMQRGAEDTSNHILWYCRSGQTDEINHRIWMAQIQVLFPMVEMERIELINKWKPQIEEALHKHNVTQYDIPVTDPVDVEIGTLYRMMKTRDRHLYWLYIPDESDRERISFLHDCRNILAHVSYCTPEQVRCLIEGHA